MKDTTLCYIERGGKWLLMLRNKKENDLNEGKWIGVGGKLESGESPEDCLYREIKEETGLTLRNHVFRGIVTFVYGDITEYMYLYTSKDFEGSLKNCDEGELLWVPVDEVAKLPIWEGDKVFLQLLKEDHPFFSLKLVYDDEGRLQKSIIDNKLMN